MKNQNRFNFAKKPIAFAAIAAAILIAVAVRRSVARATDTKCVNVYYDQGPEASYWMGKTYATLLQNLLGHFPAYAQIVAPIESYQSKDIERCAATFYIGSYFDNAIPPAFFADFTSTQKRVTWIGYNVWNLKADGLNRAFGASYAGLTVLDEHRRNAKGEPSFFQQILYKGETFLKYGAYSKTEPAQFVAPFEQTRLALGATDAAAKVLATARNPVTGEEIPYAVQKGNRFYVADVPFSYMHEADRYLVFADLLFDMLDEPPRRTEHLAFLRIEDVHPLVPLAYLYKITDALLRESTPINISLIPIFFDPLVEYSRERDQEFMPMTRVPEFMAFIQEMKSHHATFIWHGVTHQIGDSRNPFSAVSGDDFEFWNAKKNRPLDQDSAAFALDRLEAGYYELQKAGIYPRFWLTPHYQASATDYLVFARVFPWNIGRMIYFNHSVARRGAAAAVDERDLWMNEANVGPAATQRRLDYVNGLKVAVSDEHWSGQIFPYEIYGDVYGQRVLPEDLGNSQPTANEFVTQPRSTQQMFADAKRNLVLRDSWGSFFYHPQLLSVEADGGEGRFPGDASELIELVSQMKKIGYRFVNIDEFAAENQRLMRPDPIYSATTVRGTAQ